MNLAQSVCSRAVFLKLKKNILSHAIACWEKCFMKTTVSTQQGDNSHMCDDLALELFCSEIVF